MQWQRLIYVTFNIFGDTFCGQICLRRLDRSTLCPPVRLLSAKRWRRRDVKKRRYYPDRPRNGTVAKVRGLEKPL